MMGKERSLHIHGKISSRNVFDSRLTGTSNNVLTIALSTSLVIAFLLITFLVCVVVYRSGKQARVASRTNPEVCSPNDLIPGNNSAHRYTEGPPLPPDRPPEYETIPDLKERGAHGGHYQELDSSAIGGGDYMKLREDKGRLPGNGVPKDPPEYFTVVPPRPECSHVSPARNRVSHKYYDIRQIPGDLPPPPPKKRANNSNKDKQCNNTHE